MANFGFGTLDAIQPASTSAAIFSPLLLFLDLGRGGGSFTDNQQHRVVVLGAVPVDFLAHMGNEASCWNRNRRPGRIPFIARSDIPCPLQHGDEPIVRMEVRVAEVVALVHLVITTYQPGLDGSPASTAFCAPRASTGLHGI